MPKEFRDYLAVQDGMTAADVVPHTLLGMHPLGDGSGVVVRACAPGAASVAIEPTHEKKKPSIT